MWFVLSCKVTTFIISKNAICTKCIISSSFGKAWIKSCYHTCKARNYYSKKIEGKNFQLTSSTDLSSFVMEALSILLSLWSNLLSSFPLLTCCSTFWYHEAVIACICVASLSLYENETTHCGSYLLRNILPWYQSLWRPPRSRFVLCR